MSGRFELADGDILNIIVTSIVAGRETKSIPPQAGLKLLTGLFDYLFKHFGDDAKSAADQFYRDVQLRFMAHGEKDFVTTQQLPPFSVRGKTNFSRLYAAYLEGGPEKLRLAMEGIEKSPEIQDPIRISGGDGKSQQTAWVIECEDHDAGVTAEYWFLHHRYGEIEMRRQSLVNGENGEKYDRMEFIDSGRESQIVYFDISRIFGRQ